MTAQPDCTVVIPTYNRVSVLRSCLDALAGQALPPGTLEIVVADDGSTDGTGAMVTAWAATSPVPVHYFRQENAGANAARNAAIRIANAPLLLIINDDTIVLPGLVAAHLAVHQAHPAQPVAVLGRMTISPHVPHSLFAALHHDASFDQFQGRTDLAWDAFFTCNLSVKREFLLRFGLFDEDLRWHEDIELGERLVPHGLRLLYCPGALAWHHHCLSESDYLRIAAREGRSLAQWHHKRRRAGRPDNSIVAASLHPAWRHRLADAVLQPPAVWLALRAARAIAPAHARLAMRIYAKIFQHLKREAFALAVRDARPGKGAALAPLV